MHRPQMLTRLHALVAVQPRVVVRGFAVEHTIQHDSLLETSLGPTNNKAEVLARIPVTRNCLVNMSTDFILLLLQNGNV